MGSSFLSDDEKRQWDQWLADEPERPEQVAAADWPLPIQMPRKCVARSCGAGTSSSSAGQQEIIAYKNAGGRAFSVKDRARQFSQTRRLAPSEMPVGSTVAIGHKDAIDVPGYGTPFYLGDVEEITTAADGSVESVRVHYRMPEGAARLFCDDATKPWRLACHSLHRWDKSCERAAVCRRAAAQASSLTGSRFTYVAHVDEVFETHIAFNASNTLKAESKKRLAEGAPDADADAWKRALGLK